MLIGGKTKVFGAALEPVKRAAADLERDIAKCFSPDSGGDAVRLIHVEMETEMFRITSEQDGLAVYASDELGFIYGLYEISRNLLNIHDFWFWHDQSICRRDPVSVPEGFDFRSKPFAVRYRGWFINDEVLLHAWSLDGDKDKPWEMAMETLLRCGGNMIIPGTDRNSVKYRSLAAARGLYITHHHAEPLGAEMFLRAYPELEASFDLHPDKFRRLWQEGIEAQGNYKVIWNLGFRGQGDCPFWANDPRYATDEDRGRLLGELIRTQYDMVKARDPEAICCTNLYGEVMELYQKGLVELPEDIIRVWADNGYGKMVSRRQGNHDPRVPSLPKNDAVGRHGLYYHVSFYDLQAANHMTLLPSPPELIEKELKEALERGVKDFWIINSSNIKPHVYYLDFVARLWRYGAVSIKEHREQYADQYFDEASVCVCIQNYFDSAVFYGSHEDSLAGEQFTNYVPRMLMTQYMKDCSAAAGDLRWMADRRTLHEQLACFREKCREGSEKYGLHLATCRKAALSLKGQEKTAFEDSILMQAKLLSHTWQGALYVCESMESAFARDYKKAFYQAGKAKKEYEAANGAMREREHGKWRDFYKNECLTDVKQTAWVLETFMGYLRCLGEGPHYYAWQREFLYAEADRRITLITNMENHLKDNELFQLMEQRWGDLDNSSMKELIQHN